MKWYKEIMSLFNNILAAAILSLFISIFIFQPTEVLGSSMQPTLESEEIVFLSKLSHTLGLKPEYGDIVVVDSRVERKRSVKDDFLENPMVNLLKANKAEPTYWIKRIIGKPGDVLELKDEKVFRNGSLLEEPYLLETMMTYNQKIVVPEGHVFVMGDNRNNSKDSRHVGSIPYSHVLGKMVLK